MSWPQWPQVAVTQVVSTAPTPVVSSGAITAGVTPPPVAIPYAPAMPPPTSYTAAQFASLTPEQQFAIQQNWQQWQTYHQQYAQWHAQYGEQYQREMQAKLGILAPTLPFVPPIPPYAVPPIPTPSAYSVPPPPPLQNTTINNVPNIVAAASRPPPPPPPPPEETDRPKISAADANKKLPTSKASHELTSQEYRPTALPYMPNAPAIVPPPQQRVHQQLQQGPFGLDYQQQRNLQNFSHQQLQNYQVRQGAPQQTVYVKQEDFTERDKRIIGNNNSNENRSNAANDNQPDRRFDENQRRIGWQDSDLNQTRGKSRHAIYEADENRTPEERAFDEQFTKWEEEFENWKRQNASHPDKKAYKEYEMKFEECRRKLLERREQMRRRKLQRKFKDEPVRAVVKSEEVVVKKPEEIAVKEEKEEKIKERGENDRNIAQEQLPSKVDEVKQLVQSEQQQIEFLKAAKTGGIPGLDLVPQDEVKTANRHDEDVTEIIDLVADQKENQMKGKKEGVEKPQQGDKTIPDVLPHPKPAEMSNTNLNPEMKQENTPLISPRNENPVADKQDNEFLLQNRSQESSLGSQQDSNPPPMSSSNSFNNANNMELKDVVRNLNPSQNPNIPMGITELAHALQDPGVLALLSAAIGNVPLPGGISDVANLLLAQANLRAADSRGNLQRISPWEAGQEPFQNIQSFGGLQDSSIRGFGANLSAIYSNQNSPWTNKNSQDNRGNFGSSWQGNLNKADDFRYGNVWQQQHGGEKQMHDDVDMRQNIFDRAFVSTSGGDESRSRSGDRFSDRSNPFMDRDERRKFSPYMDREERGRSRAQGRDGARNNQRDRSRSSGRRDEDYNSGRQRNYLKKDPYDRPMNSPMSSRSDLTDSNYFQPTRIIDYKNKSLVNDGNSTDISLQPKKVVDYGHKPSGSLSEDKESYFPMKTIDYGHSSAMEELSANKGRNKDLFHGGRNKNRQKNKNSGLQENNPTYHSSWSISNPEFRQKSNSSNSSEIDNSSPGGTNTTKVQLPNNVLPEEASKSESVKNLEEISDDDQYFDGKVEVKSADALVSGSSNPKPVFPFFQSSSSPNENTKIKLIVPTMESNNTISIDQILLKPGRDTRPKKIVIILRGPPGSGKSYIAKLIKDKEVEMGGSAPRLLSIDDYFMTEVEKEEKCPNTGKKIATREMKYEYDKSMEDTYMQFLIRSFQKTINNNLFDFVIVDCVNHSLKTFSEFYNSAKGAQFRPYTIDLLCDLETCLSRNTHHRSKEDIQYLIENWGVTPDHYLKLDVTSLLQSAAIQEVDMEDISDLEDDGIFGGSFDKNEDEKCGLHHIIF